ncbi:MAG: YceI family protein [Candidatus Paceibacterota bacterium]
MMKKVIIIILIVVLGYFVYALATKDTTSETMEETNTSTSEEVASSADTTDADMYAVSEEESSITWEGGKKIIVDYIDRGTIEVAEGSLAFKEGVLVGGEVVIDMDSIAVTSNGQNDDGKSGMLVKHLKSEDFFEVETYPTSKIVITNVVQGSSEGEYTVTGNVTIKDVTNSVTFPATATVSDGVVNGSATLTLDRSKWNVRYGSDSFFDNLGDNVIKDEFTLNILLVAKQ